MKLNLLKRLSAGDLAVLLLLLLICIGNYLYYKDNAKSTDQKAQVANVISQESDGGIIYQNLEVEMEGKSNQVVRYELLNTNLSTLEKGDRVFVSEGVDGSYSIVGIDRSLLLIVLGVVLFLILLLSIGLDDMKELLSIILLLPFVVSGLFAELISNLNILLVLIPTVVILTFVSAYFIAYKIKVALIATLSNTLTLLFVLVINLLMFKVLMLGDIYYNYVDVRTTLDFDHFWQLFNFSILLVVFGGVINNTIQISKRAETLFSQDMEPGLLIKKLLISSQQSIARRINSIFFVFFGLSIIPMVIASDSTAFWNSTRVLEYLMLFISSAFAVILSVLLTAATSAVYLNLIKKKQLKLKLINYGG